MTIKATIAEGLFQPSEITALYQDDEQSSKNKLQLFINVVVTYAVLKVKEQSKKDDTISSKLSQSQRASQIGPKRAEYVSDSQSIRSHFSHITNKTASTYVPVLRSSSKGALKPEKVKSPVKRKLSESTVQKTVDKVASPVKKTVKDRLSGARKSPPRMVKDSRSSKKNIHTVSSESLVQEAFKCNQSQRMKFIQKIEQQ